MCEDDDNVYTLNDRLTAEGKRKRQGQSTPLVKKQTKLVPVRNFIV